MFAKCYWGYQIREDLGRYMCGTVMGTEMVPETSVIFNQLTRPVA
jgi:hypothetical protein